MSRKITDKKEALAQLKDDGWVLSMVSDELKADKELVMAAVEQDDSLDFASDELKADKEVVMAAVNNDIDALLENGSIMDALEYASDELKTDPEILGGVDIDFLKKRGIL